MKKRLFGLVPMMFLAALLSTDTATAKYRVVRATLTTTQGDRLGTVTFLDVGADTDVRVSLNSGGLSAVEVDVFHGFHIHSNDNPANGSGCIADPATASPSFMSADGHYTRPTETWAVNEEWKNHPHHVGDMPPVYFNSDGTAETRFRLNHIEPSEVIGRAVILHALPDNFANIPHGGTTHYEPGPGAVDATKATGDSGARIACGVIR